MGSVYPRYISIYDMITCSTTNQHTARAALEDPFIQGQLILVEQINAYASTKDGRAPIEAQLGGIWEER